MSKHDSASEPNSDPDRREQNAPSPDRWPLTPLVSAADVPAWLMPTIKIPEAEFDPLKEHGIRRSWNAYGTANNHALGILGEGCYAKYRGSIHSVDTALYERGDGGVDLELHGFPVDVKTAGRRYSNRALIVDDYQELRADFYVLVHRIGKLYFRLVGYAPRKLVANASKGVYHGQSCHVVPQRHLFPFPPTLR